MYVILSMNKSFYEQVILWTSLSMIKSVYDQVCLWSSLSINKYVYEQVCLWTSLSMNKSVYEQVCLWTSLSLNKSAYEQVYLTLLGAKILYQSTCPSLSHSLEELLKGTLFLLISQLCLEHFINKKISLRFFFSFEDFTLNVVV